MLRKIAIWYLRKQKVTVVIGASLNRDTLQLLHSSSYIYDNSFINATIISSDGHSVFIPSGKFYSIRDKKPTKAQEK